MKEFWLWVTIVSLIIACLLALFILMTYVHKETRRVEAMIIRLEEKKREKVRIDPVDDD